MVNTRSLPQVTSADVASEYLNDCWLGMDGAFGISGIGKPHGHLTSRLLPSPLKRKPASSS